MARTADPRRVTRKLRQLAQKQPEAAQMIALFVDVLYERTMAHLPTEGSQAASVIVAEVRQRACAAGISLAVIDDLCASYLTYRVSH